ncbi:MAG: SpaA isopeptide-forming pilin-related protein, partial [Eubacteriales bacterium]
EGNYTLSEKTAPEGYVKSDETYTLAVRSDIDHTVMDWGGEPGVYFFDENEPDDSNFKYARYEQVTFVNEAAVVEVPTVQFTVNKTDADGNPLAGATFSLTGTGNFVGNDFEAVSGADGIAVFDVPDGFYSLSEKTAPEGYVKSDEAYGIAIWDGVVHFYDEDAETDEDCYSEYQQVTFVNNAEVETPPESGDSPQTGSNGMTYLWIALLLVSGLSAAGLTVYSRKKNRSAK